MSLKIPDEVDSIIKKFEQSGFEAFVVGGCVRDIIMGKTPEDWDITTNATPDKIKEIFECTLDTGSKYGTVTVKYKGKYYEATTYRVEDDYINHRFPGRVDFTSSIRYDLKRRDFTVNAIAYNRRRGIIDPFNGAGDIQKKTIMAVGCPDERFSEDALRILRAIRFSAQLDFEIEKYTKEAIKKNGVLIINISKERIQAELSKILVSKNPGKILDLFDLGLFIYIFPDMNDISIESIRDIFKQLKYFNEKAQFRWASFFAVLLCFNRSMGLDTFQKCLSRLKLPGITFRFIMDVLKSVFVEIKYDPYRIRKLVCTIGLNVFKCILEIRYAFLKSGLPVVKDDEKAFLDFACSILLQAENGYFPKSINDLEISGSDLIKDGIKEGREIGSILNHLFEAVVKNPELNEKEKLLSLAKQMKRKG